MSQPKYEAILQEWEGGCFYTPDLLAEAYAEFMMSLLMRPECSGSPDLRAVAFLKAGYAAYLSELEQTGESDPNAEENYELALNQVGGRMMTRSQRAPVEAPQAEPSGEAAGVETARARSPAPEPERADPMVVELPTPQAPIPLRPPSPQPGPSGLKRPREDDEAEEDEESDGPTLQVLESRERELKQFKTKLREEVMLVENLGTGIQDKEAIVRSLFDTILERQREAVGAEPHDRCMMHISSTEKSDRPLWFNLRRVDQLNSEVILDKLARVLQSNETFIIDGKLRVYYVHVPTPDPGGHKGTSAYRRPLESFDAWLQRKIKASTIFCPQNTGDNMCLARAVVMSKLRGTIPDSSFRNYKQPGSSKQTQFAEELWKKAGFQPDTPADIDAVVKLQKQLGQHRLVVFTDQFGKDIIFKGPMSTKRQPRRNVYLLWHNKHFYAIFSPGPAFGQSYYCTYCLKGFDHKDDHRHCEAACQRCSALDEHTGDVVHCADCGRSFFGPQCMRYHRTAKLYPGKQTACEVVKYCENCDSLYKLNGRGKGKVEEHICGSYRCSFCKKNVTENHKCFMQQWEPPELHEETRYIRCYLDLESVQAPAEDLNPEWLEHKANYLVCQQVCSKCEDVSGYEHVCEECGTRQHVFHSLEENDISPIGQFLDYLRTLYNEKKTHVTVFAHNNKSYDGVLTIFELLERNMRPKVILNGGKILSMSVGRNLVFKDSLCFLPQKLSQLPKSFGLDELRKGYFPYYFNTPENYNYVGPIPDKKFHSTSFMKKEELNEFSAWYDKQFKSNYVFDMRKELFEYTVSDVCILREACERFRQMCIETNHFDPLHHNITLSSTCFGNYRKNFLEPNTIGMVPAGGYRGRDKQSFIALEWLDYEQFKLGDKAKIVTAESGRELTVAGFKVDGYAEVKLPNGSVKVTVWEFWGCWHHGCPDCFKNPDRKIKNSVDTDAELKYERTLRKIRILKNSGVTLIQKWEHDFTWDKEHDNDTRAFFAQHKTGRVPPLRLREAMYGGRTSCVRTYCKADLTKGEKIKFFDVCSEYPNANLRGEYPIGHPTIYLNDDPNMPPVSQWNGVAKITVLPPRDLFFPVLPERFNKKLCFVLCPLCAQEQAPGECTHDRPEQRYITGTWCAPEIKQALEDKYTIVKVHELYQYPATKKLDLASGEEGLFSGYVRSNMALKQHASGWPASCTTPEAKQAFIEDVRRNDGIELDPEKMVKNSGLRFLAKLQLNSFWGKMGERTLRPKTVFVKTYEELMQHGTNDAITIDSMLPIGEKLMQLTYMPIVDADECYATSSLVHAAFTTCYGRLQLLKYLNMCGTSTLYFDTDSVCFLSRPGQADPPLGTHLGDLTDQIADDYGEGSFITQFCSGGPKNYACKVAVGGDINNIKIVIKVRGISINSSCDDIVTFENLYRMVMEGADPLKITIPAQIARIPRWRIVTRTAEKMWRPCPGKRRKLEDSVRTVPHGFKPWPGFEEEDFETMETLEELEWL